MLVSIGAGMGAAWVIIQINFNDFTATHLIGEMECGG